MTKLKDFSKELDKALKETLKEIQKPSNMQKIGNELKDIIVKRTQLGFSVEENEGTKRKFKPLSDSYKQQRKNKLGFWTNQNGQVVPITDKPFNSTRNPKLDSTTSASKSNVTRTGKMLKSIGVLAGFGRFIIGFKTSKQAQKAAFVSKDRPFLNVSKVELKRITKSISTKLREIIRTKINF